MTKLELSTDELLMLKDLLEGDIQMSSCGISEYDNVDLMQYYLDRAKVLVKVSEELGA